MSAQLALTFRGGRVEGIHNGSAVVTDSTGTILYSQGDPHFATYMRSSVKMFQAIPVVSSGAADRFALTEAELSVCCASHTGAEYHLRTVEGMLAKLGLVEGSLGCGAHEPSDKVQRNNIILSGTSPTQIHNNCSGKHAGMLAACLASGWPVEGYTRPEHPLQKQILAIFSQFTGIPVNRIGTATDGCSLPTFYVPIDAAATAMARFTEQAVREPGSPAGRIFRAIVAHPEMIQEEGGFDTELIRALSGRGIAKRGAMAMCLVGINSPDLGPIGLAVKLNDGNDAPMPPAALHALEAIGAMSADELAGLERFRTIRLSNWNRMDVGEIRSGS